MSSIKVTKEKTIFKTLKGDPEVSLKEKEK